ncbi:hypothetical protein AQUCO_01700513v1 [Aquilegia coerulea]|uniref:NTF2 domain-containing protein n=1 Tax=Aquilegia coerulea TaxID=218851 RepID=A0A2G5DNB3_AQUCA|nr:hypothetical protein AQUCO_01700513v1 [Aquilegia coerulea]
MDPDALAKALIEHTYTTLHVNRNGLANLYQDASMLSFEGQKIQGSNLQLAGEQHALKFSQMLHLMPDSS